MHRSLESEIQLTSAITGKPVKEIEKTLSDKKHSFSIGKSKFIKPESKPTSNIRGLRANMIVFDCSIGCSEVQKCLKGMECPYDESQN